VNLSEEEEHSCLSHPNDSHKYSTETDAKSEQKISAAMQQQKIPEFMQKLDREQEQNKLREEIHIKRQVKQNFEAQKQVDQCKQREESIVQAPSKKDRLGSLREEEEKWEVEQNLARERSRRRELLRNADRREKEEQEIHFEDETKELSIEKNPIYKETTSDLFGAFFEANKHRSLELEAANALEKSCENLENETAKIYRIVRIYETNPSSIDVHYSRSNMDGLETLRARIHSKLCEKRSSPDREIQNLLVLLNRKRELISRRLSAAIRDLGGITTLQFFKL